MSVIEKRYAQALLDIVAQNGLIELYVSDFYTAVSAYSENPEFQSYLLNPSVTVENKLTALNNIFAGKLNQEILNLLKLLVEKGRIKYLPAIFKEFSDIADEKRNILHMTIISPFSLDELQVKRLTEKYRKLHGSASVKADLRLDKSLLGGIKVVIGDKVIDGTTAGKLKALKDVLVEKM
jgi:ATP synthase, F1 delta subunit